MSVSEIHLKHFLLIDKSTDSDMDRYDFFFKYLYKNELPLGKHNARRCEVREPEDNNSIINLLCPFAGGDQEISYHMQMPWCIGVMQSHHVLATINIDERNW